jgi:hypothetical protein
VRPGVKEIFPASEGSAVASRLVVLFCDEHLHARLRQVAPAYKTADARPDDDSIVLVVVSF